MRRNGEGRSNGAGEANDTTPQSKRDRTFDSARAASKRVMRKVEERAPNPEWKTLVYDAAGNLVGLADGYTPTSAVAKPRPKSYDESSRKRYRPKFTEAPMWSDMAQGWHRKTEQLTKEE